MGARGVNNYFLISNEADMAESRKSEKHAVMSVAQKPWYRRKLTIVIVIALIIILTVAI